MDNINNSMNSEFDHDKFKVDQRKNWDSVASGWQKWWQTFENGAQHVSDRLIELAGIRPGNRVLDIATGIGEPAISAAKVVGKGVPLLPQTCLQKCWLLQRRDLALWDWMI